MAVAVLANDERMTYSHSGLSMSSTSPFIQHDQDMLPGICSAGTHFFLVKGRSFSPQPCLELQRPESKDVLEMTGPANNDEYAKSSAHWTMAKKNVWRASTHLTRFHWLKVNVFLDCDGTLWLSSLETWQRYPQASFVGIQRLASYRWWIVRDHQPCRVHAP